MRVPGYLIAAEAGHGHVEWWAPVAWAVLVFLVICGLLAYALPGIKVNVPRNPLSRALEHVYLFIENMCVGVIGPQGRKYIPLVFTVYVVILCSNLLGLFGLYAPTSNLGITLAMALIVVFYVQWEGIRANGPLGYVKHFFGPPLGLPIFPGILITLLLFFIEVVSEAAKMISLSLRLYGNISGEHRVGQTLGGLVPVTDNFSLPVHALLLPLGVFVSLVQALVFTMLTCVYLSLFVHHEEKHAEAH